ncbi:MAG: dienelactone hydrolase family protein [Povalibacter sp.]|jgi:carboxymethylenebutenolidase
MLRLKALKLAALFLLTTSAFAADSEAVVRELSLRAVDLMDHGDTTSMEALLAPSFVLVRGVGQVSSRADFLLDLRGAPAPANASRKREWTNIKLSMGPDSATFVGRVMWKQVREPASGVATYSTLVTQHWHLIDGAWRLASMQRVRLPPTPEVRTFRSGDLELKGMLYKPAGSGPFPVIVYAHGNEPDPTEVFEAVAPPLVAKGYVVWGPHRRGSGLSADAAPNLLRTLEEIESKQGMAARSRYALEQLEGPQLDDTAAAVVFAKTLPFVDPQRVFLMGNSFGGVLVMLGAERGIGVRAAADFAGSAMNWERSQLFRDRMLTAARNARIPVFLAQAANDFTTAPTTELDKAMTDAGKPHRAFVYPAFGITPLEGHGFGIDGVDLWSGDVLPYLEQQK